MMYGKCSACDQPAVAGAGSWHHVGGPCKDWRTANFVEDEVRRVIIEAEAHADYLVVTLIPDLRRSGFYAAADDFELCVKYIDKLIAMRRQS